MGQHENTNSADELLRFLSIRKTGSSRQFKSAVEFCFGSDENYLRVARRLCALGHVEFDWDGGDLAWRVVPPSFFRSQGKSSLCGILSESELQHLREMGCVISLNDEEFGDGRITRLAIREQSAEEYKQLRKLFPVAQEAYRKLLQRLPSLSSLLARQPFCPLPETALRFNIRTYRFDEEVRRPNAADGLLKEIGYGKSTYYFDGRKIDFTSGLWLALAQDPMRRAQATGSTLVVPTFPDLPPLYERVLYFAGAKRTTTFNVVTYESIDHGIGPRILAKLGLGISKEQ